MPWKQRCTFCAGNRGSPTAERGTCGGRRAFFDHINWRSKCRFFFGFWAFRCRLFLCWSWLAQSDTELPGDISEPDHACGRAFALSDVLKALGAAGGLVTQPKPIT